MLAGVAVVAGVARPMVAADGNTASAESDPRWGQAVALQEQEDYQAAAALFGAISTDYPKSQRAALRMAICEHQAGARSRVVASYQRAIRIAPFDYWAEVALFRQAELHQSLNDPGGLQRCVDTLQVRFPESRWTARAVCLAAAVEDEDPAAAQVALDREEAAYAAYLAANGSNDRSQDEQRLERLAEFVSQYGDTRTALAALDTQGHLLIRNGRRQEAIVKFEEILNRVEAGAPQARIVHTALQRVAALYHAEGRKREALDTYLDLVASAGDAQVVADASTQAAGLAFELVQAGASIGRPKSPEEWEEVRVLCRQVHSLPEAGLGHRARAALMLIESYCWEDRLEDAVEAAETFLEAYSASAFRKDTATVCFFAGEALQKLERYDEALGMFERVIAAYPVEDEIWRRMDHLPRTYFRAWETLRLMEAPPARVEAAGDALLERFPESGYAEHVRVVRRQEGR